MANEKPYKIYRGVFKEAVREYSNDRMDRDPKYRREVRTAVKARKAARRAHEQARSVGAGLVQAAS
jgi:hypothetical protein